MSAPVNVTAPMMATVWKVPIALGDTVEEGQPIVVLESMKMELPLNAPAKGTVVEVAVDEGTTVQAGDLLVVINP